MTPTRNEILVLRKSQKFYVFNVISIVEAAVDVLTTSDVFEKARLTKLYCSAWHSKAIHTITPPSEVEIVVPSHPARPTSMYSSMVANEDELSAKLARMVKKNTVEVTIHGIANAESYAIDLFWDLLARYNEALETLSRDYVDDLVFIAEQEAFHFLSWSERLLDGYSLPFGCFPFQDGLWQSATDTSGDILARLSVINLTHEAKGLDTYAKTRQKLVSTGDVKSIAILDHNFREEVGHVSIGVKWFKELCSLRGLEPINTFHNLSEKYFKGKLREPFNHEARLEAGLTPEWYLPIAG